MSLFNSGSFKDDKAAQLAVGLNTIEDVRPANETITEEVTTIQQIDEQPSIPSAPQSWAATTKSAPAPSPVPLPTVLASKLTSSIAPSMREVTDTETSMPNMPSTPTTAQTLSIAMSRDPVTGQKSSASASTSSAMLGPSRTQYSDSDEEMPEIDTRSDSD